MVMDSGGRISNDLDTRDEQALQEALSAGNIQDGSVVLTESDGKRVEITIHNDGDQDSEPSKD